MLDLGWSEILVIAIVLIIVVGPQDLPGMLRNFGRIMSKLRGMAGEFRSQLDEALKEADLEDVKKTIDDARKLNPTHSLREAMNPIRQAGEDIRSDLQKTMRTSSGGGAPSGSASDKPAVAQKDPAAPPASGNASQAPAGGQSATGAAKDETAKAAANAVSSTASDSAGSKAAGPGTKAAAGRTARKTGRKSVSSASAANEGKAAGAGNAGVKPASKSTARKTAPRKSGATRKTSGGKTGAGKA